MTAPGARAIKRRMPGKQEPRPCPTCYAPMRLVGKDWVCERHGKAKA